MTKVYLANCLTAYIVRSGRIYLPTGYKVMIGKIQADHAGQYYIAEKLEVMKPDGDAGVHHAMLEAVGSRDIPKLDDIPTRYTRLAAQLSDLMNDAEKTPEHGNPLHTLNQRLALFTTKRLQD